MVSAASRSFNILLSDGLSIQTVHRPFTCRTCRASARHAGCSHYQPIPTRINNLRPLFAAFGKGDPPSQTTHAPSDPGKGPTLNSIKHYKGDFQWNITTRLASTLQAPPNHPYLSRLRYQVSFRMGVSFPSCRNRSSSSISPFFGEQPGHRHIRAGLRGPA